MGNRSVKRIIEKRLIRYLLSAVIFGIIYSILSLIDKGNVKIGSVLGVMALYLGADDVFQHFFQRQTVSFIHSQKEEREHETDHQEHGGAVPDTATGKQVSRISADGTAFRWESRSMPNLERGVSQRDSPFFYIWNL